jgi:methionine-gamma-lyase
LNECNRHIGDRELIPESLMIAYGYQTSTFTFASAAEGKRYFDIAYGLDEPAEGEHRIADLSTALDKI